MSKGGIAVLIVAALVFTALGFVLGNVMQTAADSNPGTLVTESYIQKYVGEVVAEMQAKIDDLEMRILDLSGGVAVNPAIPEPGGTPGDSTSPSHTPTTPKTSTPNSVKIKSNGVNVRSEASTTASIVGSVEANAVLTYLGQKNGNDGRAWYNVQLANGTEGWVAGWLCYEPE